MVDEQGNVTGLIDWNLTQTMPRCVRYARYHGWTTRDWDPDVLTLSTVSLVRGLVAQRMVALPNILLAAKPGHHPMTRSALSVEMQGRRKSSARSRRKTLNDRKA